MARIIAHFSDEDIHTLVDQGKIQNTTVDRELRRVLIGRRDKILFRWLRTLSPLTRPTSSKNEICFRDLAVYSNIVDPTTRAYDAFLWEENKDERAKKIKVQKGKNGEAQVCAKLGIDQGEKKYFVLEVVATNIAYESNGDIKKPNRPPVKVHFYREKDQQIKIVALERDLKVNYDLPLKNYSNPLKTKHYYNDDPPDFNLETE